MGRNAEQERERAVASTRTDSASSKRCRSRLPGRNRRALTVHIGGLGRHAGPGFVALGLLALATHYVLPEVATCVRLEERPAPMPVVPPARCTALTDTMTRIPAGAVLVRLELDGHPVRSAYVLVAAGAQTEWNMDVAATRREAPDSHAHSAERCISVSCCVNLPACSTRHRDTPTRHVGPGEVQWEHPF